MADPKPSDEQPITERKIGEWFQPRLTVSKNEAGHLELAEQSDIQNVGGIDIRMTYDQKTIERARTLGFGLPIIFVIPQEEKEITTDDIELLQQMTETRAMSIRVTSPLDSVFVLPFTVELMLPSGRIPTKDLIGPDVANVQWIDPDSEKNYAAVFIPDNNIKDQIKIRIVDKEN
ncbi:MAG: hypothetical protein WD988_03735 [Candidatus Curtissbacteria bacterium]